MNDARIAYTVNLLIGAILAGVMSVHWRLESRGGALRYWIVAAWTLTVADLLFVVRSAFANDLVRLAPTAMVTIGQLVVILAAQRTTEREPSTKGAVIIAVLHTVFLLTFVAIPELAPWRSVGNSVVWSTLAFMGAWVLSRPVASQPTLMRMPAFVLAAHGTFHLLRLTIASHAAAQSGSSATPLIQLVGDLEVSLFMVALFVSVLIAFLEQRHRELGVAAENVRQLSAMLPVCAWCKNVRDDDGYWKQIDAYLETHRVSVTHSICEHCMATHFEEHPAIAPG